MTKYIFRFNVEGGGSVDFNLSEENFEKLSEICEEKFPENNWKTKIAKSIEA